MRVKKSDKSNKWLFHQLMNGQVFELDNDDNLYMKIEEVEGDGDTYNTVNLYDGKISHHGTHAKVAFHGGATVHI